jgi:MFS transporter, DHA2 family, multidrug resistance protein
MATAYVLPNYLIQVQGLKGLQIGAVLSWIALPQFVLVPLVALCLKRLDARLVLVTGFAVIALGSWLDAGLTHDWNGDNFLPSQVIEAVGLALSITALVTYAVANITPPQAAAIAATIQIARLIGNEFGSALIQTFVRKSEQVQSNLLGLHVQIGTTKTIAATSLFEAPFDARAVGSGDPMSQALATMAALVRREAYVLAYIDSFWLIAWVLTAGLLLVLLLRSPPPNPLTPPRLKM